MNRYLISIGALLSAIAVIFMSGKRRGKQDMEAKTNETILKQTEEAQEIIHRVGNMSNAERKRLREKYTRD